MEVVAATPNGNGVPPFHNHDVREWSKIDNLTGVLERARLETDHWTASTNTSCHKYGKVVDSRARSDADGAVQQRARRQLEVFQSSVPGGRLQVIKSHTVSSSKWTSKSPTVGEHKDVAQHFGELELSLNPLDLRSQKSKATVGRSVGRRPPSRPRGRDETSSIGRQDISLTNVHNNTAAVNLHRVSRLCHQIHENAVKQTFGRCLHRPPIQERESGDGIEIIEVESVNSFDNEKLKSVNGHASLTRAKSTSSENLHLLTPEKDKPNKGIEDLEDLEQLQNWRRTSKIRRSLQFPNQNKALAAAKPIDLPENTGSVRKIREDLETGRRLSTALRGNNVDLEALDQILQSISNSSGSDKNSNSDKNELSEKDIEINVNKQKRNSFVTVESLQEVRGRLRRTNSPTEDIYKIKNSVPHVTKKDEETDDGIVTEESNSKTKQLDKMPASDNLTTQSRVRSYVYGMEAIINKKPMLGTGSLESRASKQFNGTCGYRNEDWYNRRKSYGFEQVHNHHEPINSISKNKNPMDSSTDSGICRSSEIVLVPTANKNGIQLNRSSSYNSEIDSEKEEKNVFNKNNKHEIQNGSVVLNGGSVKRYTSIFEQKRENSSTSSNKTQDLNSIWNHHEEKTNRSPRKDFEGTTITIPIPLQHLTDNFSKRQFNDTNEFSDWSNSLNQSTQNDEIKRHSIAVDESKYVVSRNTDNKFRRTSLAVNDKVSYNHQFLQDALEDDMYQNKKQKKVEFCKTEVHFAAESGKVNIVATDEKPPPTNNFRRRRRNSTTLYNQLVNDVNKSDLPVLHFGDSSYEKSLFRVTDQEDDSLNINDFRSDTNTLYDNKHSENEVATASNVTVSTNQSCQNYLLETDDDQKENLENEAPKGILKNKPVKPKPYLLGDNNFFKQATSNEETGIWGIRLKPVHNKPELPMWRSTVTLKNTFFDKHHDENYVLHDNSHKDSNYRENKRIQPDAMQPEFQKLLRSLRPAKNTQDLEENQRNSEHYDGIRIVPPQVDPRRSSWSVCDMIKQVEDVQKSEIRGYSTKVNIGGGEATVIEHNLQEKERHPTWPRNDDNLKGFSNLHRNQITHQREHDELPAADASYFNESKSTWEKRQKNVKAISSKTINSPVVLRKSSCNPKKQEFKAAYNNEKLSSPFLVGQNNLSKKENEPGKSRRTIELSNSIRRKKEKHLEEINAKAIQNSSTTHLREKQSPTPSKERHQVNSPLIQKEKRTTSPTKCTSPKNSPTIQKQKHSPSPSKEEISHYSPSRHKENHLQISYEDALVNNNSINSRQKSPSRSVLRNPRKSEMAYFGIIASASPKSTCKSIENNENKYWQNKPDLLQHYDIKETAKYRRDIKIESKRPKALPEKFSKELSESPIYENINEIRKYSNGSKTNKKEFDSSILDELTKAADQILQAVNDYAEDAQKQNAQEEKNRKNYKKEKLDTISETKSWKQQNNSKYKSSGQRNESVKVKLKHTSSTSSVESTIADHRKSITPVRRTTADNEKHKKKINNDTTSSRAATKARRLQRASSREALLQSHGSSSEDLPVTIEVPVRKPRLSKKTKATSLTVTNVMEISKALSSTSKKSEEKGKSEERVPVGALPEIRHKTAVSTIRSTAEKSRDHTHRSRTEELKKMASSKKETSKLNSTSKSDKSRSISNKDPINHRISTASIKKCNKFEGSAKQ